MTAPGQSLEDQLDSADGAAAGVRPTLPAAGASARRDVDCKLTRPVQMLLRVGVRSGVSDFHLDVGRPPAQRLNGKAEPLTRLPPVELEDLRSICAQLGASPTEFGDYSLVFEGERFRVAIDPGAGGTAVLRHIPKKCYTLDEIGVPDSFRAVLMKPQRRGLILITGATGSGKSRTFNGCINELNHDPEGGVGSILGDPIEYYHDDNTCRIRHREYGIDFHNWTESLRRTLRQDPDFVALTELRDPETASLALSAAETGHLIIATLHNAAAKDAFPRILDLYPPEGRPHARAMLAHAWIGTLAQQLVPTLEGGRTAAFEFMVPTPAILNHLREDKYAMMDDAIRLGSSFGMVKMESYLAKLVHDGVISRETAFSHAFSDKTLSNYL